MAEHTAENDAATERCPGSLRPPRGTTDLPFNGGWAGICPRCKRAQRLRQDGSVRVHTRPIPPGTTERRPS